MFLVLGLGLAVLLVYVFVRRVILPFVKSAARVARREPTDHVVEHLVAEHRRLHAEQQAIERAMQTNPSDPTLLGRIEKLTGEAESTDRAVLGRLNRPAAQAFGMEETPPLGSRLWLRPKLPTGLPRSLTGLVRFGVLLLVLAGGTNVVTVALTQGPHHPSRGSVKTTFRAPGLSGYTSSEIVSMVEHKVSAEGVFNAAQESIGCPQGSYATGAVLTCTLASPKGNSSFDVEVTQQGISIKAPNEAG